MYKKTIFIITFILVISTSSFAQDESKAKFWIGVGFYQGIISGEHLDLISGMEIKELSFLKLSGNLDWLLGSGNFSLGLETGYSSGSRFGGTGSVDFIPVSLTTAYVFPLGDIFYIGPRLKLGGLGISGADLSILPMTGLWIDAELRSANFPVGLYFSGGVDAFPTSYKSYFLPAVEVGIRIPRGKMKAKTTSTTGGQTQATGSAAGTSQGGQTSATGGQTQATGSAAGSSQGAQTSGTGGQTQATGAAATGSSQGAAQTSATGGQTQATGSAAGATATTGTSQGAQTSAAGGRTPTAGAAFEADANDEHSLPQMGAYAGTRGQSIDIALGGGQVGRLSSIYFSPDTANLFETYHSTLESTGRQLAANPSQRIVLRAYTAHFGTPNGRFIVSTERARFCRDYLIQQYGIATNRITIEVFGSDKAPEQANATWESYRCAELIIVGN